MDNSSIIISVVIVLCIAAGVTAYGLTNDSNNVFNDLAGFTPDDQGNTGIGNNSTGLDGTGSSGTDSGTGASSGTGVYSSSSSGKHNISPEQAKKIAESAGWEGSWCYSVKYNSNGYYTCLLKDKKGNTGYVLVGSGTGRILEGAWSNEVDPDQAKNNETEKNNKTNKTADTNSTDNETE